MELRDEMERCRVWIESALEYSGDTHDFDDIVAGVEAGLMQFWPAQDSCVVTEIAAYPKHKALNIFLAGGNMDTLMDMFPSVEEFARINECKRVTLSGRPGWQKVMDQHGFKPAFVNLSKEI